MKSKLAIFIAATALFVGVWFVRPAFADSSHWVIYIDSYDNQYRANLYNCANNASFYSSSDTLYKLDHATSYNIGNVWHASIDAAVSYAIQYVPNLPSLSTNSFLYISKGAPLIILNYVSTSVNAENVFLSYEDYENSLIPPEDPSEFDNWWDSVSTAFMDFVGSDAMSAIISGDWLTYLDEVLYGGLWTVPVGEGEDDLVEFYTVSATPTPSPSPTPTLIPVQVNIDPSTGDVTYHYNVIVSGTPVPTSSPVNPNTPTGSGGGGGSELIEPVEIEDYYEPDDSLSLPNLRIFQFKLPLPGTNSTTDIGIDSIDNNFEVMNGYLEDNAEAITTVSSFFQVIPPEWFLLIGAIACFPIIAAMIKSLLGG